MSLNREERRIIVGLEYEKATRTFQQIEEYRKLGHWETIANRLYYSVFHAVAALLIKDGHSVNTHKGTVGQFGLYYVKTGIVPSECGRLYSQLQMLRNNSDYNCLKFRKCYAASLNLTFRFISLTMSSSSSMMALRTSGA